jgi:adenosylcobinamide kinase/adenosylcobinamide-phosphate guanylyltransferase
VRLEPRLSSHVSRFALAGHGAPPPPRNAAVRELILGGQKSGKSRAAEMRANRWLQTPGHEAVLIATAQAGDAEMAARIARHRADRAMRAPGLLTHEEPRALAAAVAHWTAAHRLVVVDCLMLWLTQMALPLHGTPATPAQMETEGRQLAAALQGAAGPVVLVSNEIGFGVAPLSAPSRQFIDALGMLHQSLAACCERVTLMVAGCEWPVKRELA